MKRKCEFCQETTEYNLDDFYLIGWSAFSIDNKKSVCWCPNHKIEGRELIVNLVRQEIPKDSEKKA